jgi:serine/threonine protein kinase
LKHTIIIDAIAMAQQEKTQRSREQELMRSCCGCRRIDRRIFLGEQNNNNNNNGDNNDDCCNDGDPSEPTQMQTQTTTPAQHLGYFVGCDPQETAATTTATSPSSVRSLTTGCLENDQELVSGMIKASASRLRRECVDDRLIATIEKSGTVGGLLHSQIELGDKIGEGSFSNVFAIKSLHANNDNDRLLSRLRRSRSQDERSSNRSSSMNNQDDENNNPIPSRLVIKILKPSLIRRPSSLSICAADLVKEGAILASLGSHPNVVSLVAWTPTGLGGFGNSDCGIRHDSFFLVLSRLEKTLQDQLVEWRSDARELKATMVCSKANNDNATTRQKEKTECCWQERFLIMKDLANAIKHVHSKGIIHRDLKPNNIGFDSSGTLKLFDFDVSRILPEDAKRYSSSSSSSRFSSKSSRCENENTTFRLTQHVGTQRYMSPECARGDPYNAKADVYAFGLVCHEILSVKLPFAEFCRSEDHYKSVFLEHARPSLPRRWPKALRNFLSNCWSDALSNRPTMEKAFGFLSSEEAHIAIVTSLEKNCKCKIKSSKSIAFKAILSEKVKGGFLKRLSAFHKEGRTALETVTTKTDSVSHKTLTE